MLNEEDYRSLKASIRGWTRERLFRHDIQWPPKHGWRKRLLREYEEKHRSIEVNPNLPAWNYGQSSFELERISMKKLYQEKSGDYSY